MSTCGAFDRFAFVFYFKIDLSPRITVRLINAVDEGAFGAASLAVNDCLASESYFIPGVAVCGGKVAFLTQNLFVPFITHFSLLIAIGQNEEDSTYPAVGLSLSKTDLMNAYSP